MSIAEIERFAADLKSNEALRAEAEKAQAETSHETPLARAVAFAASRGYAFTVDEAKEHAKATAKAADRELTDGELDGVTGGVVWLPPLVPGGPPRIETPEERRARVHPRSPFRDPETKPS